MALSLFRTGAKVCAIVTLMSLAGCGNEASVLAPATTQVGPKLVAQTADINPGTEHAGGPTLTLYNADFRHTSRTPGYFVGQETWVELEVIAGEPITVNWFGRFRGGAHLRSYRWTLDIDDLTDETPRINEATDLSHWSQPSASTTSATVGPFTAGEQHLLFVEVTDTNGFKSLATLHLTVVEAATEEIRRH